MTVLTYLDKVCHGIDKTNSSEAVVLQYVDDILLCADTEEACSRSSEDFLNFLAGLWLQGIKRKGSALSTVG